MTKKRIYRTFQDLLLEQLQDPEFTAGYLKEMYVDGDGALFCVALHDVMQAKKYTVADLAKATGFSAQSISRMLSKNGNPRNPKLKTIMHAMGFSFDVKVDIHCPIADLVQSSGISEESLSKMLANLQAKKHLSLSADIQPLGK